MIEVDVSGPAVRGLPRRDIGEFVRGAIRTLQRRGYTGARVREVSIAFVDDGTMKELNSRWRGKRSTTDVLTFPSAEPAELATSLGDIVISLDRARRQAREEKHSLAMEVRYLLLHGIIHAHGYDHETDEGEMNEIEIDLRGRLGLD